MTPRFPRTRKYANPYALAGVDGLFCLLWLSAFAAQANFNGSGKAGSGLGKSKAVVGFGVFIWFVTSWYFILGDGRRLMIGYSLLWALTTLLSLYSVVFYRREGYLPGASRAPHNANQIDPDKDAFSTAPHDEYAPVHNVDDHDGIHDVNDTSIPTYGGRTSSPHNGDNLHDPFRDQGGYMPPSVHDDNTGYMGYSGESTAPAYSSQPPSDVGYSGQQGSMGGAGGRVQFPHAPYS